MQAGASRAEAILQDGQGAKFCQQNPPIGRRETGGVSTAVESYDGGVFGFLSGSTNAASRVTPFRPGALTLDVNTGCQKNASSARNVAIAGSPFV